MKTSLNIKILTKLSDNIFKQIDRFFQGPCSQMKNISLQEGIRQSPQSTGATVEWELNQDVSDILVNDMYFIINHIFPQKFFKVLIKFKFQIMLYFLLDDVDDRNIIIPVKSEDTINYQRRIILYAGKCKDQMCKRTLYFIEWLKKKLHYVKHLFQRHQSQRIYFLIGDFSVHQCGWSSGSGLNMNSSPGGAEFLSPTPFHKRN